jgi:hypothetical protein
MSVSPKEMASQPIPTNREIKRVDIIVLKYKEPEVEVQCAQRIIENTEWPYTITFFDNRPSTKNIAKIWNELIRSSACDYILLLNTDAFVPKLEPCWLTRMMEIFDGRPECLVVLPKVSRTSCKQQKAEGPYDGEPELLTEPFAAQCTLFKKEAFEKLGYFDEEFLLHGQDTEWAMRLLHSQYQAFIVPAVWVQHLGHYATKKAVANGEYDKVAEDEYTRALYEEKTRKYKSTSLP